MTFMVARAVLMRLTKVSERNWSVGSSNNLGEFDLVCRSGQHVATAYTSLGFNKSGAFKYEQDLFEVWLRERSARCNIAH
jgi:hypothetical protein